ncbi:MAG: hypothetical protein FWF12_00615 [Betaproteobacteria bacterium]|nr:hypothetical protein [Betaproteobacteria bacterium]
MKKHPLVLAAIFEIEGSGFWSGATKKRIKRVAKTLLAKGVDEATVADVIREFWRIGITEHGE